MLVTSVAGGDVTRVGAVFSMPVCVIREGLPTMLADYLFACTAGGGFMVRQPVFIPAGVRAEATGSELPGSDRLPAM